MINAYERLNIYIEAYKLNSHNGLYRMKNYYDCEDEYWWVIEQLLDKYIDVDDKNKKAIEYIEDNKQYAELEDYGENGNDYVDADGVLDILKH